MHFQCLETVDVNYEFVDWKQDASNQFQPIDYICDVGLTYFLCLSGSTLVEFIMEVAVTNFFVLVIVALSLERGHNQVNLLVQVVDENGGVDFIGTWN